MNKISEDNRDINVFDLLITLYAHKFKLLTLTLILPLIYIIYNIDKPDKYILLINWEAQNYNSFINTINGEYPNLDREINFINEVVDNLTNETVIEKTLINSIDDNSKLEVKVKDIKKNIITKIPNFETRLPIYSINYSFNSESEFKNDFIENLIQNSFNFVIENLQNSLKSHIESKERSLSEKSNFEKRELQITLLQLESEYALMEKRLIFAKKMQIDEVEENIIIARENNILEPVFVDLQSNINLNNPKLSIETMPLYFYGLNILKSRLEVLKKSESSFDPITALSLNNIRINIEQTKDRIKNNSNNMEALSLKHDKEFLPYNEKLSALNMIDKNSMSVLSINQYDIIVKSVPKTDIKILLLLSIIGFSMCSLFIFVNLLNSKEKKN